jgi:hypothetical protein
MRGLGSIGCPELRPGISEMPGDGVWTQDEPIGDLAIRQPVAGEVQHLDLPLAERKVLRPRRDIRPSRGSDLVRPPRQPM